MPRSYASPFRQLPPEVTPGKSVPGTGLEVALKSERFCLIVKGYVNDQFPRFMGRRVRRSTRIVVKQPLLEVPRHTHVPLVLMIDALYEVYEMHGESPASPRLRRAYFSRFVAGRDVWDVARHTKLADHREPSEVWRPRRDSNTRPSV
jgi:hypothetical protein